MATRIEPIHETHRLLEESFGPRENGIKAILFDMDGVLIDARDWHYEALNLALSPFGLDIDRDAHLATFDGLPTRTKLDMLSKSRNLPRGLHSFVNTMKQKYTIDMVRQSCHPVFQHQYALSHLKAAGYKIAVCSNSIRQSLEQMMQRAGLDRFLDLMLSNEDVTKPKPDPEIYTTAITRLGLTPSECLIVEDNEHGIRAARASGAHVLVVGNPSDVTYERLMTSIENTVSAP
ncbi:MAG: HAD family phosphatase [Rhizomicrobium sp.]|nr:HAD family phosphatase [Rhizomicrobium sp.]